MGEEEDGDRTQLLPPLSPSLTHPKRTGSVWTAASHVITAVIGSGVLSLAWSVAQLGWIAGPLAVVTFAGITVASSRMLSDLYRSPDPAHGPIRNSTYTDAVKLYLGKRSIWVCGLFQQINLYGTGIAYTITSSICMRAIKRSNCFHREGHQASCTFGESFYMLLFGGVQILFSQIPNIHAMEWLSVLAAVMSFSYSSIGVALGLAKIIGNGGIKGTITGMAASGAAQKVWRISEALGDIAFAYPFSVILLEIQDTLKSPPAENQTMKNASMIAISLTTIFYLSCGCLGYGAFGEDTPGNLLTGFGFYEPYWLIDIANACVVVHLVGGYQVFSQPLFALAERWLSDVFQTNALVNTSCTIKAPLLPACKVNLLRLCFRTGYVISTTGLAMLFPYFNEVMGVIGGLNFWPLTIYFPIEMYVMQKKIHPWTSTWVFLQLFSVACLAVSVVACIGSVEGLFSAKLS